MATSSLTSGRSNRRSATKTPFAASARAHTITVEYFQLGGSFYFLRPGNPSRFTGYVAGSLGGTRFSGDESDATLQGNTHVSQIPQISGLDRTINRFAFDPDYEIDLILSRELLGGVSNAVYFRPWMSYQLPRSITFCPQNVTAAALRPVATPGNS